VNVFNIGRLRAPIKVALKACHEKITPKCERGTVKGCEGIFDDAVKHALRPAPRRAKLRDIGSRQPLYSERYNGTIDAYQSETRAGWEYKVVRMPRDHHDAMYDLGQLAGDYFRLRVARKLKSRFLVVLLYGPLVEDSQGNPTLYRHFHNQMFVEREICLTTKNKKRFKFQKNDEKDSDLRRLGFHRPYSKKPKGVLVVRHKKLAVVVITIVKP
jgi:hypothetical protein